MNKKGFTLVELVIVIAIVIILSVVSVPIYRGYTKNAKMSEGYALLGMILSAQKAYYSQYGNFLDDNNSSSHSMKYTCNEEVLGIDARGNKYFTAFVVNNSAGHIGYAFDAYLIKPNDLCNDISKQGMALFYNLTSANPSRISDSEVLPF